MTDRILLLTSYSKNNIDVFNLTFNNHQNYAKKWCLDMLNVQEPYNPHNNFEELKTLLRLYKTVISVGSDVVFTNFSRDIRHFNRESYPIVIQEETAGRTVNGDFIFFNRALLSVIDSVMAEDAKFIDSQRYFDSIRGTNKIMVLPAKTIQSMNPFDERAAIKAAAWSPGDFSMHANNPGHKPDVAWKIDTLTGFFDAYGIPDCDEIKQ